MQALSTQYALGISIDQVQWNNINPPELSSTVSAIWEKVTTMADDRGWQGRSKE